MKKKIESRGVQKKEKPWYKKWYIWVINTMTLGIVIFLIPIIINNAYMKGIKLTEPNTVFSASDILMFYGSIISSVITIIALIVTIRFTAHQNFKEQKHQRKMLIADYKKVELERNNNDIVGFADKIKQLYLLNSISNHNRSILEQVFKPNSSIELFVDEFQNLNYWVRKLDLDNKNEEKQLVFLLDEFKKNVANSGEELQKRIKVFQDYQIEKNAFERKKKEYLDSHIEYRMNHIISKPKEKNTEVPPYGVFDLVEPETESTAIRRFIDELELFRDANKEHFLEVYDKFIICKNKCLLNQIAKLYEDE